MTTEQTMEPGRVCRSCGTQNRTDANLCSRCGANLDTRPEAEGGLVDEDPGLRHVDPNNRVELDRFECWDEAELACGLLRANDIPCELSPMPLPGLPADIILWVHKRDAEPAWALLADAEREAPANDDDAA